MQKVSYENFLEIFRISVSYIDLLYHLVCPTNRIAYYMHHEPYYFVLVCAPCLFAGSLINVYFVVVYEGFCTSVMDVTGLIRGASHTVLHCNTV